MEAGKAAVPMCDKTPPVGRVSFVGAGPGAGDLITVRGARRIGEADVVVWPASAIPPEAVRGHATPNAELVDCSRYGHEHMLQLYRRAAAQRLAVARLVPGDAALWSGVQRQFEACRRLGLQVEIVPGVSALAAVLAATGRELAEPAVVLARQDGSGGPAPHGGHDTLAVTTSAARTEALAVALRAAGRPDDTPVLVGYKPSRPDQLLLATTLGELAGTVKRHRLWLPALFLIGRAPAAGARRTAAGAGSGTVSGWAAGAVRDGLHRRYRRRRTSQRAT
jgi:precorrin-4/cobalt-precorrin-4 C11-methyltransferase